MLLCIGHLIQLVQSKWDVTVYPINLLTLVINTKYTFIHSKFSLVLLLGPHDASGYVDDS